MTAAHSFPNAGMTQFLSRNTKGLPLPAFRNGLRVSVMFLIAAVVCFSSAILPAQESKDSASNSVAALPARELLERMNNAEASQECVVEFGKTALKLLNFEPDDDLEFSIRIKLSKIEAQRGKLVDAMEHAQKASEIAERNDDKQDAATAKYHLALAQWYSGKPSVAIDTAQQVCRNQRAITDDYGHAKTLTLLGAIHRSRSAYLESIVCHKKSLEISERLADENGIAKSNNNIGLIYWKLGQFERALEFLNAALGYYRDQEKEQQLTSVLSNLGLIHVELERPEAALVYLNECLTLLSGMPPSRQYARVLSNIGYAAKETGDCQGAIDHYLQALKMRRAINDDWGAARVFGAIGEIYACWGDHAKAIQYYLAGLDFATDCQARDEQSNLQKLLAASYQAEGRYALALKSFKSHFELEKKLKRVETTRRVAELEAQSKITEQEQKVESLEQVSYRQELKISRQRSRQWLLVSVFSSILALVGLWFASIQTLAIRAKKRSYHELRNALSKLNESEDRFRRLFEESAIPKFLVDVNSKVIVELNPAAEKLCGLPTEKLRGMKTDATPDWISNLLSIGSPGLLQKQTVSDFDDRHRHFEVRWTPIAVQGRCCALVIVEDVTVKYQIEEEQNRREKMEALGVMAGGIAHDFRNALTAIMGFVDIARNKAGAGTEIDHYLENAELAGDQASWLTSQLMTFAKGGDHGAEVRNVNQALQDAVILGSYGSMSEIEFEFEPGEFALAIEEGQFKQIVTNLVINAHQAMENEGKLVVKSNRCSSNQLLGLAAGPGDYLRIQVQDFGAGIPAGVQERIFDPYYTTKNAGSGLGLSTAYTIVQQNQGHLEFHTQDGIGTTFSIYLPIKKMSPDGETVSGY